jgi:tetratricopeptide (TPR) repeat protein
MKSTIFLFILLQVSIAWGQTPEQWFQEGNRFSAQGRFEEAVKAYEKSIAGNVLSPVAHYNLGIAFKNLGQLDNAAKSLEKSVELEPINMSARVTLGNVYNLQERWSDAIGQLTIVVHRKKNDAEAHGNLAWSYFNYKEGPPFKKLVILNLSKAIQLFKEQKQLQAAEATQKFLEEARNKFGVSLSQ